MSEQQNPLEKILKQNYELMDYLTEGLRKAQESPEEKAKFDKFVEILRAREARTVEQIKKDKEFEQKRFDDFALEYGHGSWRQICNRYNRQHECMHVKGVRSNGKPIGDKMPSWGGRDYNIMKHTFITGEQVIRCLSGCGWEVWNTPEFSFKWNIGVDMLKKSSNIESSSEIPEELMHKAMRLLRESRQR